MVRSAAAMTIFFMAIPCSKKLESQVSRTTGHPPDDRLVRNCTLEYRLPHRGRWASVAPSLRRGLGVHVDDLNAAVDRVHRRVRILRLALAIANGDEIGAIDAVFLGEVPLDGIG